MANYTSEKINKKTFTCKVIQQQSLLLLEWNQEEKHYDIHNCNIQVVFLQEVHLYVEKLPCV